MVEERRSWKLRGKERKVELDEVSIRRSGRSGCKFCPHESLGELGHTRTGRARHFSASKIKSFRSSF